MFGAETAKRQESFRAKGTETIKALVAYGGTLRK